MSNLTDFFSPSSIAIIGVSDNPKKVGYLVAQNCINQGYKGDLFLVNPSHDELFGRKLYHSLSEIQQKIDLAVCATPADVSMQLLDELHAKGVKNVVIFAAGFRETDEIGKKREEELIKKARQYEMQILGPNCIGFVNTVNGANLTFLKYPAEKGNIGFVSQSGALGSLMVDYLANHANYGFSYFISLGNKTIIDETDVLNFLCEDKDTKVIGMYLEDVKQGAKFAQTLFRVAKIKPVVILKSGATTEGSKAAISHTGSMMGDDTVYSTVFSQNGGIRAHHFFEFMSILKLYAYGRIPQSKDVMILSNAGGLGVLLTDELIKKGLSLVTISEEAKKEIIQTMGSQRVTIHNPIDLLGDAKAFHYKQAIEITMKEKNMGSVIILLTPQANTEIVETTQYIAKAQEACEIPIFPIFMGEKSVGDSHKYFEENKIASFSTYDNLPSAIQKIREYEEWKKIQKFEIPNPKSETNPQVRISNNKKVLNLSESMGVLEKIGVPTVPTKNVFSVEELKQALVVTAYPVVLKISSDTVIHKTEKGGVITNVNNYDEAIAAYTGLCSITHEKSVVVQKMVKGYELIIGAKRDRIFGPVIMIGLGGVYAELLKETFQVLPPISYELFSNMLMKTKLEKFVKGFRGMAPLNVPALYETVMKVGELFASNPNISELDINPLIVVNGTPLAVDGRIVLT